MIRLFILLLLVSRALAGSFFQAPLANGHETKDSEFPAGIISNPEKVANRSYDYIIVGGGLTGLTVAATLLEGASHIEVLVIESGFYGSEYGPKIDDLNTYGQIFGSSVDHAYETSPQRVENRVEIVRSGNGLGGSTLINGGTWTRPHKAQIDSWRDVFGNPGWGWGDLVGYMDKIEDPRDPGELAQHFFDPKCHGKAKEGRVKVGVRDRSNLHLDWSPVIPAFMDTVKNLTGAPNKHDLCCGEPWGASMFLNTLNESQVRTDAARSWLDPVLNTATKNRITVLTGQLGGKVLLEPQNQKDSPLRAVGVEYGTHNKEGWKFNAMAKEEVFLAAGSTISPLILQYSGIGPKDVLDDAGIEQRLELPVGLNLQDQTTTSVVSRISKLGERQGQAAYFATFEEVFGRDDAPRFEGLLNDNDTLRTWAAETVAKGGFHNKTALFQQYVNYQNWLLRGDHIPYAELFLDTDTSIHFDLWTLIPFTRGYVKILGRDPYIRGFEYNPRYFENELDVYGQAAASRLARQLSSTKNTAMEPYYSSEILPGPDHLSMNASLDEWARYVKQNFRPNYHGVGTCSMMEKELGGVVDHEAKVYGVGGLRVIDGSIPPTQVSSHVMTVFYGMALKIACNVLEGKGQSHKLCL